MLDALDAGWTIRTSSYAKAGRGKNALVEKAAGPHGGGRRAGPRGPRKDPPSGAITRRDNPQMVAAVFDQRSCKARRHSRPADTTRPGWRSTAAHPRPYRHINRTVDPRRPATPSGDTTGSVFAETVSDMGSLFSVPGRHAPGRTSSSNWRKGMRRG